MLRPCGVSSTNRVLLLPVSLLDCVRQVTADNITMKPRVCQLEDMDHLFEKGVITGGVLQTKGGRTVEPEYHATHPNTEDIEKPVEGAMVRRTNTQERRCLSFR